MDPEHDTDTDAPPERLVDANQPMRDQSVQMLMLLEERFPNRVRYRYPLDMSSPESVANIRNELGPATTFPGDPNGYYYFLYLTDVHKNEVPVFLPEGEVRSAMFVLAVSLDVVWASEIAFYDWLLP